VKAEEKVKKAISSPAQRLEPLSPICDKESIMDRRKLLGWAAGAGALALAAAPNAQAATCNGTQVGNLCYRDPAIEVNISEEMFAQLLELQAATGWTEVATRTYCMAQGLAQMVAMVKAIKG